MVDLHAGAGIHTGTTILPPEDIVHEVAAHLVTGTAKWFEVMMDTGPQWVSGVLHQTAERTVLHGAPTPSHDELVHDRGITTGSTVATTLHLGRVHGRDVLGARIPPAPDHDDTSARPHPGL